MKILLGNTGLVGTSLKMHTNFEYEFNSRNIDTFNDIISDGYELTLCCLPATKWLVNKNLQQDFNNIMNIINVISKKTYSKVTLISTIDVYNGSPLKSDELYNPNVGFLNYGNNRYLFELMVRAFVKTDNLKIFRLPALFNEHIKKNILYDLIHENNVGDINTNSAFQWYNLDNLYRDILYFTNMYPDEMVFNLFTEPIETSEIIKLFPHLEFNNFVSRVEYDYQTKFGGYIETKETVLEDIKKLINGFNNKQSGVE